MKNRFLEMDAIIKREESKTNGFRTSDSFSGPTPLLQDITHAGPYRIAYDRLSTLGIIESLPNRNKRTFKGTAALQTTLNNWTPYLDKVLKAPAYILTGGLTVNKPGEHGIGNAIDVDGFWWSDTEEFLANNAPSNWYQYLTIEATLRKVFPTVLNYDYNSDHHDHWHCDLGGTLQWSAVRSKAVFAQRALNEIWRESLSVDGNWGRGSNDALVRNGYDFSVAGGWDRFLDDIINRQSSQPSTTKSFSAPAKTRTNTIRQVGKEIIKRHEGFNPKLFNDAGGHCEIGFGTLIHHGACNGHQSEQPFMGGITEQRAIELMDQRLLEIQDLINSEVKVELSVNQYDALASFVYNVGDSNFKRSTLLKELNKGNYNLVSKELKRWIKAKLPNGKLTELSELGIRRNEEAAMFDSGNVSDAPLVSNPQSLNMSVAQSIYDNLSKPFYDTGEHALAGEGDSTFPIPTSRLIFVNGVQFTYGQIITMADLFKDVDEFKRTDKNLLKIFQHLVLRNENFYRKKLFPSFHTSDAGDDIDWNSIKPEGQRDFNKLAADNFEHFGPAKSLPPGNTTGLRNHKTAWENYHKKAIWSERTLQKTRKSGMSYLIPDNDSLIYNAFGDHYLTDAFAAGHKFNKDMVIRMFKSLFTQNGQPTAEAKSFMTKLAEATFTGKIKDTFSKLEAANITGHPLINSVSRFTALLNKSLEPDKIDKTANFAVKIIHDRLGFHGIDVENKNIKNGWKIYGDGRMDLKTLEEMRKAVGQSINNLIVPVEVQISSSASSISSFDFTPAFKKVWELVPVPTSDSEKFISHLIKIYTDPASENLLEQASKVMNSYLNAFVDELVSGGDLRKGDYSFWVDTVFPHIPIFGG